MDFGNLKLYIKGSLVEVIDQPYIQTVTEERVAKMVRAGEKDSILALESAQSGFQSWSALSLAERTKWMLKFREAVLEKAYFLRKAIMHEMGKPMPVLSRILRS